MPALRSSDGGKSCGTAAIAAALVLCVLIIGGNTWAVMSATVFRLTKQWLLRSCAAACLPERGCVAVSWSPPGARNAGQCIGWKDLKAVPAGNRPVFSVPLRDGLLLGNVTTGVYKDEFRPYLASVALVTASNQAYSGMLHNWQCWASKHGLQWNVLAFDRHTRAVAGPNALMLPEFDNAHFTQASNFREKNFNKMSCGKLHGVYELLRRGVSVLFSDPDNVFVRDPIPKNGELANLIADARVEYVYSLNGVQPRPRAAQCPVNPRSARLPGTGDGNTGFYFVRATPFMAAVFETVLHSCKARPKVDDQTVFWDVWLRNVPFAGHCDHGTFHGNSTKWCCLSPERYATGVATYETAADFAPVLTYHANFAIGKAQKFQKLQALPVGNLCTSRKNARAPT